MPSKLMGDQTSPITSAKAEHILDYKQTVLSDGIQNANRINAHRTNVSEFQQRIVMPKKETGEKKEENDRIKNENLNPRFFDQSDEFTCMKPKQNEEENLSPEMASMSFSTASPIRSSTSSPSFGKVAHPSSSSSTSIIGNVGDAVFATPNSKG